MQNSVVSDPSWLQGRFEFPDEGSDDGPVLGAAESREAVLIDEGTACERALMALFGWRMGTKLRNSEIVDGLVKQGHAKSTIARSVKRLFEFGTLKKQGQYHYVLVKIAIPKVVRNASRPGAAPNRFGHSDSETVANYVREFLMDRLDVVIENPNAYLVQVLRAVGWSEKAMIAMMAQDAEGVKLAMEEYKKLTGGGQVFRFEELMESLQVGLFPEQFMDDEEVREEIEQHVERVKRLRYTEIANAMVENERIAKENEERVKAGQEPLPLVDCSDEGDLNTKEFQNGLIPLGGGERVGMDRLKAFLMVVGRELPAGM